MRAFVRPRGTCRDFVRAFVRAFPSAGTSSWHEQGPRARVRAPVCTSQWHVPGRQPLVSRAIRPRSLVRPRGTRRDSRSHRLFVRSYRPPQRKSVPDIWPSPLASLTTASDPRSASETNHAHVWRHCGAWAASWAWGIAEGGRGAEDGPTSARVGNVCKSRCAAACNPAPRVRLGAQSRVRMRLCGRVLRASARAGPRSRAITCVVSRAATTASAHTYVRAIEAACLRPAA